MKNVPLLPPPAGSTPEPARRGRSFFEAPPHDNKASARAGRNTMRRRRAYHALTPLSIISMEIDASTLLLTPLKMKR
jgi:hypothetical protein